MKKCTYTGLTTCLLGHLDDPIRNALEKRWSISKNDPRFKGMSKKEIIEKIMSNWTVSDESCEIPGCKNIATRITSTETKYIVVCDNCWHNKYKK